MPRTRISIVIPCFNHGHFIREALASVAQVKEKELYEVIIVDDGSTDVETIKTLLAIEAEGYFIFRKKNEGLGAARNAGIKLAKGDYILPIDCDNKIRPEYLHDGIQILDAEPSIDVVYGNAEYFGEKKGIWTIGDFNLQKLMVGNYIDACAIFRKSTWERMGGYDEKMPVMGFEDWDFWLRIAFARGRFHYVNKTLFDYRFSEKSMINLLQSDSYEKINTYMLEKFPHELDLPYLNHLVYHRCRQKKSLAFRLLLFSLFPHFSDYLAKRKRLRKKDIVY